MLSNKIQALQSSYQNGECSIGEELIKPCLGECSKYRRGTGYFNSSALIHYADVLDYVITEKVKIEIICSPKVDQTLFRVLERHINSSEAQKLRELKLETERVLLLALGYSKDPKNIGYRERLLSYFLATGLLEVRFAIPRNLDFSLPAVDERNMYHVKTGYFVFDDDNWVSFDGSFNESDGGLRWNTDRTQVFRSWREADKERGLDVMQSVDRDWNGANPHISVFTLENSTLEIIRRMSSKERPKKQAGSDASISANDKYVEAELGETIFPSWMWKHQRAAVEVFLTKKRGILEMATGTGKTKTALEIMRQLFVNKKIQTAIICTYGTDLLEQWHENVNQWLQTSATGLSAIRILRNYGSYRELQAYLNYPGNSILLLSRDPLRLKTVLTHKNFRSNTSLVLHDEIHGFGSPGIVSVLSGSHSEVNFRLGLSATPEREYDAVGSKFIENEVGEVIFRYDLAEAISDGILCEFDYRVLRFKYTAEDVEARKAVFARKAAAEREGSPWDETRLFIELSRVKKKASLKPKVLFDYLNHEPGTLKASIIFVLDRDQGDEICKVVESFTYRYKTYYAGVDSVYLNLLSKGEIDTLIACERLNEGVDIRELRAVFLVSSDRARLDTIQRIGRCLRKDPSQPQKRAIVVDFIAEQEQGSDEDSADNQREEWLSEVSRTRFRGELNDNP